MRSPATALLALSIGAALAVGGHPATAQRGLPSAEEYLQRADSFAASARPDITYPGPDGRAITAARCATGGLTPTERGLLDAVAARRPGALPTARNERLQARGVRVVFHVVHHGDEGRVERRDVLRQLRVLRKAFRTAKFRFRLAEIRYVDNQRWHRKCQQNGVWREMTAALSVDPTKTLNIYICRPRDFLGAAYVPGPWSGQSWDAVRVLHSTLPGGTSAPYDLGDTVVHEVGHYLGLDHTFHRGCTSPGDAVDDTPFEARPDYVCARGRDTCPQPGTDPVENFMDYGPDTCLREFTAGQRDRMHNQVAAYRPAI